MKMLYVGCGHFLQSTDDCLMWAKLGIEWYDTSYYHSNNTNGCGPITPFYGGEDFYKKLLKQRGHNNESSLLKQKDIQFAGSVANNLWSFSKEFISEFDIVFFNHAIERLEKNWDAVKNKKVILKTFGMHHPHPDEIKICDFKHRGIHVVRNSTTEYLRIPEALRKCHNEQERIIVPCVIPNEHIISNWNGQKKEVVTFSTAFRFENMDSQHIRRRDYYINIRNNTDYSFKLYGACDEMEPLSSGFVSHNEKIEILQNARVSLVTGTPNSAHTYSIIESLCLGIPTVAFGKNMWQSPIYEVDQIIQDGVNGFICQDVEDATKKINLLMEDYELAKKMGEAGRKRGVELYGRENKMKVWRQFLFDDIWKGKVTEPQVVLYNSSDKRLKHNGKDVCTIDNTKSINKVSAIIGVR